MDNSQEYRSWFLEGSRRGVRFPLTIGPVCVLPYSLVQFQA